MRFVKGLHLNGLPGTSRLACIEHACGELRFVVQSARRTLTDGATIQIRVTNSLTGAEKWVTVAHISAMKTLKEPARNEPDRQRRAAILKRVLYLIPRSTIVAGNEGVTMQYRRTGRSVVALPRLLVYFCDQPEERAVLCLKLGACSRPCSLCDGHVGDAGSFKAVQAKERGFVRTLERQDKAALYRQQSRQRK